MSDPKSFDFCYDFPRVVLHRVDCPRYTGGVCHPLETPVEPYTDEEARAVEAYAELIAGIDEDLVGHELARVAAARVNGVTFHAPGRTGAPVGVTPDPRVQELLDLGFEYDQALEICADPRYQGVIAVDVILDTEVEDERRVN